MSAWSGALPLRMRACAGHGILRICFDNWPNQAVDVVKHSQELQNVRIGLDPHPRGNVHLELVFQPIAATGPFCARPALLLSALRTLNMILACNVQAILNKRLALQDGRGRPARTRAGVHIRESLE